MFEHDQNTLFLSDMDGTLLNADARISDYTRDTLNELIADGLRFSVATARTAASVGRILEGVNLTLPLVLMNGVVLYDMAEQRYVRAHILPPSQVEQILTVLEAHEAPALLYTLAGGQMYTYYSDADSEPLRAFREERVTLYQKGFTHVPRLRDLSPEDVIFCTLLDTQEKLAPVRQALLEIPGLTVATYRDVYSADLWYLEAFSGQASKYQGARELRDMYGFECLVGFGDNKNDLPLFAACDASFAVGNARPEVRDAASGVIAPNTRDGVARWLRGNYRRARNFGPIRRATAADGAAIEAIFMDVVDWLESLGLPHWERERVRWDKLSQDFRPEDFCLYMREGEPVACMALVDHDPDIWPDAAPGEALYIHKLAVKRSAAGQGLSSLLLDYGKEQCRARGIRTLRLDVHKRRPKVRAIYERAGFNFVEDKLLFGRYETALYACDLF